LQRKAAKHDLAPKVGQKFSFTWRNFAWDRFVLYESKFEFTKIYGYLTQIAKTPIYISEKRRDKLEKELEDIGIDAFDLHEDNLGKIGKTIVCIDFDPESAAAI